MATATAIEIKRAADAEQAAAELTEVRRLLEAQAAQLDHLTKLVTALSRADTVAPLTGASHAADTVSHRRR